MNEKASNQSLALSGFVCDYFLDKRWKPTHNVMNSFIFMDDVLQSSWHYVVVTLIWYFARCTGTWYRVPQVLWGGACWWGRAWPARGGCGCSGPWWRPGPLTFLLHLHPGSSGSHVAAWLQWTLANANIDVTDILWYSSSLHNNETLIWGCTGLV